MGGFKQLERNHCKECLIQQSTKMQVILMTQFIMVRIILLQVFFFFPSNDHQLWYNHLTITYIYTDLVFIPEL